MSKLANFKIVLCKAIEGYNYVQMSPKFVWSFFYMYYIYYWKQQNLDEYVDFAKKMKANIYNTLALPTHPINK